MSKLPRGLIKMKDDCPCLAPHRFLQFVRKPVPFATLLKMDMLGFAIYEGYYWIICRESDGAYVRVPFARNEAWFIALTSDPEFEAVASLPQIYITGTA